MGLPSILFLLLLSVSLVSGHIHQDDQTTKRPTKGGSEEGRKTPKRNREQRSDSLHGNHECQEGNPLGASYSGRMNVTTSGATCQVWAVTEPHKHDYTEVGEHNHCRNPDGLIGGVWCYTTDPEKQWELCAVPKCVSKSLKVLDFSADNDDEPDGNGEYTGATLDAGPLPESFTICLAIMVEAWTTEFSAAYMFTLLDVDGDTWGLV